MLCEKEGVQIDSRGLALLARAAEGSVRDSLSLLDQVIAYAPLETSISAERVSEVLGVADRRVLFDLSRAILAREPKKALSLVDTLFYRRPGSCSARSVFFGPPPRSDRGSDVSGRCIANRGY